MSQKLFDEEEFQQKKVKVQDIEDQKSLVDRIKLSGLPDIKPDFNVSVGLPGTDLDTRKIIVLAVEVFLVTYLALGYAGLVPLF